MKHKNNKENLENSIILTTLSPDTHRTSEENLGLAYLTAVLRKNGYNVEIIDGWLGGLEDKEVLVSYMNSLGFIAPFFFLFLQAFQVVFPVIPGGASCLAGVLAFGPIEGFIYNYVGLTLGSIVSFFLSRNFGLPLINKLFKKETVDKYLGYVRTKKFEKIFFFGIFLPGAPDDLLCYIAGISGLTFFRFLFIILIGKPFTLIFYSLFTNLF